MLCHLLFVVHSLQNPIQVRLLRNNASFLDGTTKLDIMEIALCPGDFVVVNQKKDFPQIALFRPGMWHVREFRSLESACFDFRVLVDGWCFTWSDS